MIDGLARADSAVAACADAAVWALSEQDLIAALDATHRLQQRLAAVQLAVVRELDGRGTAVAQVASSTTDGCATASGNQSPVRAAGQPRVRGAS
ncbi:hypothetical protein ACFYL6_32520 [Micromonospora sp. NPDC007208]|uniref:hypothetical protein n=1 Tax=Micromonospora sp. NPDC007208 TaxID=3364236 RepID=UPI0036B031C6